MNLGWFFHQGGWGPWGIFAGLAMLVFWALVITAIVLLVRRRPTGTSAGTGSALSILEERYARGEIDEAEFRERRRVLAGEEEGS